ncbi:MAG: hypothetical protein JO046_17865 [Solirubrobacterales bacterium]|nr:hypothetical protein [Solirubrobacterales bacterium]
MPVLLRAVALALIVLAIPAARASASTQQISMIQDDVRLDADPAGTLARMRLLGADAVRVSVHWDSIAPAAGAKGAPRGFNASDPAAYPSRNWRLWDEIVTIAHRDGIRVNFDLMGGAPRWAMGSGRPAGNSNPNWEPSASAFAAFVRAIGTRYSGNYDAARRASVPGDPRDLPRVDFWTVWNEPDYGPSLAPQGLPGNLTIENSPRMYRNLLNAAWSGLRASGHNPSTDTIAFGELAPRGESYWGVFSGMKPLTFLRALYCVDGGYHQLRGIAAQLRGCPTTAAGSGRFRAQNPALFEASAVSDHPYMRWYPPGHEQNPDPVNHSSTAEYSSLGVIGNLTRALDRLQGAYGSRTRFPIYDTEFGYITSPPKHSPDPTTRVRVIYLSPANAAEYTNWAEYISWRDPRLISFEQYLLFDPSRPTRANNWGGFASGLLTWNGIQKATYYAWRLPLYLPVTQAGSGRPLEVWGCIRPARLGLLDSGLPQTAQLQFAPRATGQYAPLQTITIGAGSSCYFDLQVTFPSSGTVRLAYTYPGGDALLGNGAVVVSRAVSVTVR